MSPHILDRLRSLWSGKVVLVLRLALVCLVPLTSTAQFTTLHDFGDIYNGANPLGTPVSDGTFLYGTTSEGGVNSSGTIYKMNLNGTGYTKLLDFNGTNGSFPVGALFYSGGVLYGMAQHGGANGYGNLYKINTDGTGFGSLIDFSFTTTGAGPSGAVILDGGFLYGMTTAGGSIGYGTIFKIKPDGSSYAKVLDFDYNTTGGYPYGSLYTDGTFLYGMTTLDGGSNYGTIFKIQNDGTNYTRLLNFSGAANGSAPKGSLISDGTFLYGMAYFGGTNNYGTVFKIMPDGTSFSKILDFNYAGNGAYPKGDLVYDGTALYGTTAQGGGSNSVIFKINTNGTGYVKLLSDDNYNSGTNPEGTLFRVGATLYGARSGLTTNFSGLGYLGTIYKINTDGSGYSKLINYEAEGNTPEGSLLPSGAIVYGMTSAGGLYNYGTIFKANNDGTGYTKLFDFDGINGRTPTNGRLVLAGGYLVGMTSRGGVNDDGIIFKIFPDGSGFAKVLDFDGTNGNEPNGTAVYDGSTFLYGMTSHGGANGYGTIFKIKLDGTYFNLHDFNDTDGAYPNGSLFSTGGVLYGMTTQGGAAGGWGTMFSIHTDGSLFTTLIDFDYDNNGANPYATPTPDGTFLYAMTSSGGANGYGTLFKIKPDGSSYAKMVDFDGMNGAGPYGSLTLAGTYLYGMTSNGGFGESGNVFKIKTDGTGLVTLFDFSQGNNPHGGLVWDGASLLYGMTVNGGNNNLGILFKVTTTPFVSITTFDPPSGTVGTYVNITGTAFDPTPTNNIVKFNGTPAVVIAGTTTTLTAIVPAAATTGTISVTAGTTGVSLSDFTVTTDGNMFGGTVQNCDVDFTQSGSDDDVAETFLPVNPTDKVKVSFSSFSIGDKLDVYDGPDASSPKITTLSGFALPDDITATGSTGALTFVFRWQDSSSSWDATITCVTPTGGAPPVIATTPLTTQIGGKITLNLVPLITTANNNLDLTSLQIVSPPSSGASAIIDDGLLTIDYNGKNFSGTEQISIRACDTDGNCATQVFNIEVIGDIVVYNGISPNGANPSFIIDHIDLLPDTKNNTVYIFDRWQNQVWHGNNYDNTSVVFNGVSDGGSDLPSGVYYYKIEFTGGRKKLTGFLSLRRK